MKMMKVTLSLFAMFYWCAGCFMTRATEVDITKDPYNANTSMTDVGGIINQAITDMRAQGGGTIYIPAGNWHFSTQISIASSGSSAGSIVIRGDGPHRAMFSGGTDLIFTNTGSTADAVTIDGSAGAYIPRVTIRDLSLDDGNSNRNGLVLRKISNFEVSCVEIDGFTNDAILVDTCSYGSVRDADLNAVAIGIDCTTSNGIPPKGLQFDNVTVHAAATAAFRDAPQLIGCTVEGEETDGLVYDSNSSPYVSIHDTYFEGNDQAHATGSAADIYGQSSSSISLALSGKNQIHPGGRQSYPYRRVRGTFATLLRENYGYWTDTQNSPTGYWAAWDVTNTIYIDNGVNMYDPAIYPTGADNFTNTTGNFYSWRNTSETITTQP